MKVLSRQDLQDFWFDIEKGVFFEHCFVKDFLESHNRSDFELLEGWFKNFKQDPDPVNRLFKLFTHAANLNSKSFRDTLKRYYPECKELTGGSMKAREDRIKLQQWLNAVVAKYGEEWRGGK